MTTRRQTLHAALVMALELASPAWAADPAVWVVLSESGGAYAEAAAHIRAEGGDIGRVDWLVVPLRELPAAPAVLPKVVVVLGTAALRWAVDKVHADPAWAKVSVLAALLPRASYEAVVSLRATPNVSAVVLDQPVERYMELVRQALPGRRRVGVLLGQDTRQLKHVLGKAAAARGLSLSAVTLQDTDLYAALQSVLNDADVLLVLPDGSLFEAGVFQNLLITAYRRRVPVLTYSAAHVRAGATLGLYTTPAQAAHQTLGALRELLRGATLPAVRLAEPFSVAVNTTVGRSLGLVLETGNVLEDAVRRQEGVN